MIKGIDIYQNVKKQAKILNNGMDSMICLTRG
jgi:hypothetical protein